MTFQRAPPITQPSAPRSPLLPPVVSWHREEGLFDSCGGDDGGLVAGWGGGGDVLVLLESDSLAASFRLSLRGVTQPQR